MSSAATPSLAITCLNELKSADGGASACEEGWGGGSARAFPRVGEGERRRAWTSQPWLKPIFDCVNATLFCWAGGSAANDGRHHGQWSSTYPSARSWSLIVSPGLKPSARQRCASVTFGSNASIFMMSWMAVRTRIPATRSTLGVNVPEILPRVRMPASTKSCCSPPHSCFSKNWRRLSSSGTSESAGGGSRGSQSSPTPKEKPRSPSIPIRQSQYTAKSAPIVRRYSACASTPLETSLCPGLRSPPRETTYSVSSGKAVRQSTWKACSEYPGVRIDRAARCTAPQSHCMPSSALVKTATGCPSSSGSTVRPTGTCSICSRGSACEVFSVTRVKWWLPRRSWYMSLRFA